MLSASETFGARRILVADADPGFRENMINYLGSRGYSLLPAADAASVDEILASEPVDLILLDSALPGEGGLSVCRRIATEGGPPILLLNGESGEVERVIGLEMGADVCFEKSWSPRELLAHVRALLRRVEHIRIAHPGDSKAYHFRGFVLDPARRSLTAPTGETIRLTEGEFCLLKTFVEHPKAVLSRDVLHGASRSAGPAEVNGRSVDVQVGRLRRKLDEFAPDLIQTARGAGYVLDADVKVTGPAPRPSRSWAPTQPS